MDQQHEPDPVPLGAVVEAAEPAARPQAAPQPAVGRSRHEAFPRPRQLVALIAVVVLSYATLVIIRSLRTLLVMLLVSLFVSFAVEPAVQWLGRRGWRRGPATLVVFLGTFLVLAGSVGSILPLLIDQVSDLLRSLPRSIEELNAILAGIPLIDLQLDPAGDFNDELRRLGDQLGGGDLFELASGNVLGAAGSVVDIGATAVGLVFQLLTVLLISFYMVADGPRFRAALARPLPPHRQRELLATWEIAVAKTGGYIYSRLLIAGAAALVTAAFLALIGVPYPLPLGLWVGISGAFIPVVGTYLGGGLPILVALADRAVSAVWVLVFIAVYQQLENYLIAPRLQSQTMDIHPAVAFVSVLVGGTLLGAVGALLALPAAAIIQAVGSTYMHRHELIAELNEAAERIDRHLPDGAPAVGMVPGERPAAG